MKSKTTLVLFTVLGSGLLSGCGTYPLGMAYPQQGETSDQVRLAVLDCQDRAKNEANTSARVAGSFIAGLTIVGAPIAIAEERRKTREVWQDCMKAKGYRVVPPEGTETSTNAPAAPIKPDRPVAAPAAIVPPPAPIASPQAVPSREISAQLKKLNELRAAGLITEDEYAKKRKEILDSL